MQYSEYRVHTRHSLIWNLSSLDSFVCDCSRVDGTLRIHQCVCAFLMAQNWLLSLWRKHSRMATDEWESSSATIWIWISILLHFVCAKGLIHGAVRGNYDDWWHLNCYRRRCCCCRRRGRRRRLYVCISSNSSFGISTQYAVCIVCFDVFVYIIERTLMQRTHFIRIRFSFTPNLQQ